MACLKVWLKCRDVGRGPARGRFVLSSNVSRFITLHYINNSTTMRRNLPSNNPVLREAVIHTSRSLLLVPQATSSALSLLKTQNLKIIFHCVCSSRNIMCVYSVFWVQSLLQTYFQTSLNRFLNDLRLAAKNATTCCDCIFLFVFPMVYF